MVRPDAPLPDEPIYRAILLVLVLSVVAGALLALVGDQLWQSDAVGQAGTGIAVVSGLIYFVFRWLGAREARRRATRENNGATRANNGAARENNGAARQSDRPDRDA